MRSFSADLLSVLKSGSSMCRSEWHCLSGLERFASIEIREGRLAECTEGDVLAARLSIDPERRSGDIASKEMLVGRGRRRRGSTTSAGSILRPMSSARPRESRPSEQTKSPESAALNRRMTRLSQTSRHQGPRSRWRA